VFASRNITPAAFIKEFFETLTPGVIPRKQFIDWVEIKSKCQAYDPIVEYFQEIASSDPKKLREEIQGALLSADNPLFMIKGSFELLGHTNDYYVSDKDHLDFDHIAADIGNGSEKIAAKVATVLLDLGLVNLLIQKDIQSTFLGVQVGLESNRRKSVGGAAFNHWIANLLESTCGLLGAEFELVPELQIPYKDSRNRKRVDFGILHRGKPRIGVEVNFYTTSGSKPSEIKRAYENVNRELNQVGVELVWITDGAGYLKMKKSLEEAFRIHPNTYNYEMARRCLKEDIYTFLESKGEIKK
jgi:type II restriction enzyme